MVEYFPEYTLVWLYFVLITWLATLWRVGIKHCGKFCGIKMNRKKHFSSLKYSKSLWLDILSPFFETLQYFVFLLVLRGLPWMLSHSVVSDSLWSLWTVAHQALPNSYRLERWKMRPVEGKWLVQGHTSSWGWARTDGLSDPHPCSFGVLRTIWAFGESGRPSFPRGEAWNFHLHGGCELRVLPPQAEWDLAPNPRRGEGHRQPQSANLAPSPWAEQCPTIRKAVFASAPGPTSPWKPWGTPQVARGRTGPMVLNRT